MEETSNLKLPFVMPSQAQKHVPVNEGFRALDAVVQLAVLDRDLASPPALPSEGDRFIVAAGASGAWLNAATRIAAFQDGGWLFYQPRPGWLCWVADESALVIWNGSAWVPFSATFSVLQSLSRLGLGTVADATNPFAAKLNRALWTARTAAEGGDGDLRFAINKEAVGDFASLLLQTGYSGRAEIGLLGSDQLQVKTSADGSTFATALSFTMAGVYSMPFGGLLGGGSGRYATVGNNGVITVRYDDNGLPSPFIVQNFGMTAANQGASGLTVQLGSGSYSGGAGRIDVIATGDFTAAASATAKMDFYVVSGGSLASPLSLFPTYMDLKAGQLRFPATQSASSDLNTLDDYREGSTAPAVSTASGTLSAVSATLDYQKVGRWVSFQATVTISAAGTGAGALSIALPFAASGLACAAGVEAASTGAAVTGAISGSTLTVNRYDGASIVGAGRVVRVSGKYPAAA